MEKLLPTDPSEVERVLALRMHVSRCLESVGFNRSQLELISLTPVDNYHKNVFFVKDVMAPGNDPFYVVKTLDKRIAWDVAEDGVRREHDIAFYASTMVPELQPRTIAAWFAKTDTTPATVFYNYIGETASPTMTPEQILVISQESLELLRKLHLKTISKYYGTSIDEQKRASEHYLNGLGAEKTRYLLNDIKRDLLDPTGEIQQKILEKWIPLLNKQSIFCLTHKDITLSNVLLRNEHVATFIDWTHSRWDDPAYDIAYLAFWAIKHGHADNFMTELSELEPEYIASGIDISSTFPFYLAFKCIEYGRFKGKDWVNLGKSILDTSSQSVSVNLLKEYVSSHAEI